MATVDEIPTDMALEIGGNLSPSRFVSVARDFFALVEHLAGITSTDAVKWDVVAREGSTILAMRPPEGASNEALTAIYAQVRQTTTSLVAGDWDPVIVDDKVLRLAKSISDIGRSTANAHPIRFWICREPIAFGPEVAERIREEESADYTDYGTLEGILQAIQDTRGALELKIRDMIYPFPIRCVVDDNMLATALENFRHRVEIAGEIRYRRNGAATSIRADRIERLPDDDDLPTVEDVRGLLAVGAT